MREEVVKLEIEIPVKYWRFVEAIAVLTGKSPKEVVETYLNIEGLPEYWQEYFEEGKKWLIGLENINHFPKP